MTIRKFGHRRNRVDAKAKSTYAMALEGSCIVPMTQGSVRSRGEARMLLTNAARGRRG